MWIVAVAWVYVVALMALTEPSVVAGIMTFLGYCVLPLSILFYITGSKGRRARRAREEAEASSAKASAAPPSSDGDDNGAIN
jgi:cytochrome c biogenesis protein CcdA